MTFPSEAVDEFVKAPRADSSDAHTRAREPLVDVATVAEYLDVDRSWVYANAERLGARRLGAGPRARLRFSLAEVDERLSTCSASRESDAAHPAPAAASPSTRRRPMGTNVELLPIRGQIPAREAS
jgi:hypothetical protein